MAVHYYDEDDIEVGKAVSCQVAVNHVVELTKEQHRLVRPFAHPVPSREIILMTSSNFIRHTLLHMLAERIKESLPDDFQS